MAFRNKNGDYLGDQSNYEYSGKKSLNRIKAKKKYVLFWIVLFITFFILGALFLFYVALFENISYIDKNSYLLSGGFLIALAFYAIYRSRKYLREEKEYEKELEKLDSNK